MTQDVPAPPNRTPVTQLLGPGNYPRCSLCTRKMTALIRRGEM